MVPFRRSGNDLREHPPSISLDSAVKRTELDFLKSHELARMATASRECSPHVVPVIYAMDGEDMVVAIDYGTRKLKNLRENSKVALVVDDYAPKQGVQAGVMVEGKSQLLERGKEYRRLLRILFEKFEYYRRNPWKEGESPIVVIRPINVVSW